MLLANQDVSFEVMGGDVHAIVGENGAGKSTLMKVLYGHHRADSGRITLDGSPVDFRHPREAVRAGIGMVHQQLLIFPQLTSLENIVVGAEPARWGRVNHSEARRRVERLCDSFSFKLPLEKTAGEISFAHRQQIEILRVLYRGAKILILDEPTSLLAPPEAAQLLKLLKSLQANGHTILFISHRLGEVFGVADRITVLRRGRSVRTCLASETTSEELIRLIIGEDRECRSGAFTSNATAQIPQPAPPPPVPAAATTAPSTTESSTILDLRNVTAERADHEVGLEKFSLRIEAGEIFGLGAVVGNGERTLARIIAGGLPIQSGRILLGGKEIHSLPIRERTRLGLRWLPANPPEEALMPARSIWENCLLGRQRKESFQNNGWLLRDRIMPWVEDLLRANTVVYSRITEALSTLSGGNQQRIAVARILAGSPALVLLEQPTRGLDIHARERLYARIRTMCANGVTFLVISYDLDELMALSHRIGILYRGRLMGVAQREEAARDKLGRWMLGLNAQYTSTQ
jgi:simple sugar transport system ATP-binding protein